MDTSKLFPVLQWYESSAACLTGGTKGQKMAPIYSVGGQIVQQMCYGGCGNNSTSGCPLQQVEMTFGATGWEWQYWYCSLSVRTVKHAEYGSRLIKTQTDTGKWNMDRDWSLCCLVPAEVPTTGGCTSGLVQPRMPSMPRHESSAAGALGTAELLHAAWDSCCGSARHCQCIAMLLQALILS